ncbi:MSMEG_4193 family putative phosphomutase [Actinoplanes sp. NEAU-A12]|uniref:MSMEG_4193 family putative phosphomutase n=1 Tax=Actinoplanes sandaracinus TaxID=3045177 RepID=A0ABT6WKH4_9ACTN|nr:MSMEG_4193 family putative phosphomutase [Actinoplanes sandaracinus]MDI6100160.1 MSMEG_4193 family putative phosphomutase [Actinoplanes sandaracinus]
MATVLLLRHGRTTANATGELAGRLPVELDDTGRAQAARAAGRLRELPLATVVSSPLIRCRQTVELALPESEPVIDDGLIECGYGDWEGRPLKELSTDPLWPVVQHHPSAVVFPNGEAMADMSARAVSTIRAWDAKVTAEHGPESIWLACSHGDVIKAIVADALGLHLDQFQRIVADPASITVIRYTSTRPFVVRVNETGELGSLVPRKIDGREKSEESDAAVGGGAGGGV